MTVFLWILVAVAFWLACGWGASRIVWEITEDPFFLGLFFFWGPVTLIWAICWFIVENVDGNDFWRKFLRIKD